MDSRKQQAGVTLIELVIVVVIVGILAAIAVPSYRQYVIRSHRVEATTALLGLAAAQEKFYLQNNTYTTELEDSPPDGLGIPATTEKGFYDLEITAADEDGFSATATATGGQADDSHCAEFTLDQAGTKTATSTDCWSR
jgi:type IV pilus assembly protein PilE